MKIEVGNIIITKSGGTFKVVGINEGKLDAVPLMGNVSERSSISPEDVYVAATLSSHSDSRIEKLLEQERNVSHCILATPNFTLSFKSSHKGVSHDELYEMIHSSAEIINDERCLVADYRNSISDFCLKADPVFRTKLSILGIFDLELIPVKSYGKR